MGRDLLVALCLWSCTLTVTCEFSSAAVGQITDYIFQNLIKDIWEKAPHFAYMVKLTTQECNMQADGIPQSFYNAIDQERVNHLSEIVNGMNRNGIYSGDRILLATPKIITKKRSRNAITHTEHAGHRLLFPANGQVMSSLQNFINKSSEAQNVIIYSTISPCVDKCIVTNESNIILDLLHKVFILFPNRALVYTDVNSPDQEKLSRPQERKQVLKAWKDLDDKMTLFRCNGLNCQKCFQNGNLNNNCTKNQTRHA